MIEAVRRVQGREWVDRLEATVEAHILPVARVREACSIPGLSSRAAYLCRDKVAMKEVLRAPASLRRLGRACRARTRRGEFAGAVGFPLIVKPRAAAGAAGTHRADNRSELGARRLAPAAWPTAPAPRSRNLSRDTRASTTRWLSTARVVHDFISHYYPNVLEAMRTRWITPQIVATNRMDAPAYGELFEMGRRVIEAIGIGTAATHMEWFFGPKGLRFSEIGAARRASANGTSTAPQRIRPLPRVGAGGRIGAPRPPSRRYACGIDRPQARPRRPRSPYEGAEAIFAPLQRVDRRTSLAAARDADTAGRSRLHGERLDPPAPPRLRRAAPHPHRDRRARSCPRPVNRCSSRPTATFPRRIA